MAVPLSAQIDRDHVTRATNVGILAPGNQTVDDSLRALLESAIRESTESRMSLSHIIADATSKLNSMAKKYLEEQARAAGTLTHASSTKVVVDSAVYLSNHDNARSLSSPDTCGKALFVLFFQKLGLAKLGMTATVCRGLHQGSNTDRSHDDVKLSHPLSSKTLNIDCKTVRRPIPKSPSYQVQRDSAANTVDAYFVVCWKNGVSKDPSFQSVDDAWAQISGVALVAVSDLGSDNRQPNFRVNLNKLDLVLPTIQTFKKVNGKKQRNGFERLHVMAGWFFDDECVKKQGLVAEIEHYRACSNQSARNICSYFGVPYVETSSTDPAPHPPL